MQRYIKFFNIIAIATIFCVILLNSTDKQNRSRQSSGNAHKSKEILLSSDIHQHSSAEEEDAGSFYLDSIFSPITLFPERSQEVATHEQPAQQQAPEIRSSTTPRVEEDKRYREVWAIVTAYCPCYRCCGRGSPGRTSLGRSAWTPGIAADPRAIPYGTKIMVKGYGTRRVDDTGGAMRQSWRRRGVVHLDIRMTYHWQARAWGRKLMKIRIYDK